MGIGVTSKAPMSRIVTAAWIAMPFVVVAFIWLHMQPGTVALSWAQVLFLAPIVVATIFAERAYRIGPRGIERRAWGMLSITAGVLLLSEGYYSWYQVFISSAGPGSPSAFDALNVVAAVLIAVAIGQLAGVSRLSLPGALRLLFDGVAFSAVTFGLLYHLTVRPIETGTPWWESARWWASWSGSPG